MAKILSTITTWCIFTPIFPSCHIIFSCERITNSAHTLYVFLIFLTCSWVSNVIIYVTVLFLSPVIVSLIYPKLFKKWDECINILLAHRNFFDIFIGMLCHFNSQRINCIYLSYLILVIITHHRLDYSILWGWCF